MSLKEKNRICLLVFFCAAGLIEAFNSERSSSGDDVTFLDHPPPHNNRSKEIKDFLIVPATPVETTQTKNTRVRRARQRHERNRREKADEEAMREVFAAPQPDPNSIPNDNTYASNGYIPNGYNYEPPQRPFALPQQTYFQAPHVFAGPQYLPSAAPSHNTIVPNGNQVNNFYPPQFPSFTSASNPWSGVPNNFPAPFYYGPFLIIPIPICYPNNNQNQITPTSPQQSPVLPTTLNNRLGEIESGAPSTQRPPFDFDQYYNTDTGVDLKPVPPLRQPSVTPPPAVHLTEENLINQSPSRPQQSRPQVQQQRPQQSRPQMQQQRPQQQRPQQQIPQQQRPPQTRPLQSRPQPIPVVPPVGRPRPTQRPPLRPIISPVEQPPQELDAPGSEPTQGDSCVWAIVRCCSQPRPVSVPRCFELQGCPGAFFDNPCDSEIARTIANAANEIQENGLLFS